MRSILMAMGILFLTVSATAQSTRLVDSTSASLSEQVRDGACTILSTPTNAEVFIDSVFAGRTPLKGLHLAEGRHHLKLFYPSATTWNAASTVDSIEITRGYEITKSLELGVSFSILSIPSGAKVMSQGMELGTTPLFYRGNGTFGHAITVSLTGYESAMVSVPDSLLPGPIRLTPRDRTVGGMTREIDATTTLKEKRSQWLTISAGATMVVSGVLAAFLKGQANGRFDTYVRTKDETYLGSTRSLDRLSGIALVVSELSFATLTYLLLVD